MKKIITILVSLALLLNTFLVYGFEKLPFDNIAYDATTTSESDDTIRVTVDSKPVTFADQNPVIKNDRTLVPLRAIFEALGAEVTWDEASRTVKGIKDSNTIILIIGEANATVNGNTVKLDQPAEIINDRTMVPVRFISESLGCEVTWLDKARTVVIVSSIYTTPKTNTTKKPDDGINIEGFVDNKNTATQNPANTAPAISSGNYKVIGVFETFDEQAKLARWYTAPETVSPNVKAELDKDASNAITNNLTSVKLTFNPGAQEVKDNFLFHNPDITKNIAKWKNEGANAVSFWIKGNTKIIDSATTVNFAIKAKATNAKGEQKDTFYYGKIHDQVTGDKWTQVIIPLKSNGSNKNFDLSTGLYSDYPDYSFEIENITSVRFWVNTKDKGGIKNTFFGPISFWVDQIEFIKQ